MFPRFPPWISSVNLSFIFLFHDSLFTFYILHAYFPTLHVSLPTLIWVFVFNSSGCFFRLALLNQRSKERYMLCFYCPSLLCFTNLLLWPDLLVNYPISLILMHFTVILILFLLHICYRVNIFFLVFNYVP